MAKVGEGDPRWLVSDRTDGRNVNGWHWEEKNALAWSKKRIHELLREAGRRPGETGEDRYAVRPPVREAPGAAVPQSIGVTGLKAAKGDASVSIRKQGKRLAVYDLELTFEVRAGPPLRRAAPTHRIAAGR